MIIEASARISVIRDMERAKEIGLNVTEKNHSDIKDVENLKNDMVTHILSV